MDNNQIRQQLEEVKKEWNTPSMLLLSIGNTFGGTNGQTEQGLDDTTNGPSTN